MRFGLLVLCGGFALAASLATPLSASDVTVNSVVFDDVPKNVPVTVEIYDDSDENLALKAALEDELSRQGYVLQNGANLIVTVETRDSSGRWTGGGSNRVVRIGNSDNHTGTDAPDVRVSLFDNERGGILNPKTGSGVTQVAPSQFRIDAQIEDRLNGRTLWQGWAVRNILATENTSVYANMLRPLVSAIGQTLRDGDPTPN